MARYSGATFREVRWTRQYNDSTQPTALVFHIAWSEAASLYRYFNGTRVACSHFYVRRDGHVEQYIDTDYLSAADYRGGHRTISVETQGRDDGGWTAAQIRSLAEIAVWANRVHGIPLRQMRSAYTSEVGVGWHRLGVNGNFPAAPSLLAGRLQIGGGELWSKAYGKTCPTDSRIKQVPKVIEIARDLVDGTTATPVAHKPAPRKSPKRTRKPRHLRILQVGSRGEQVRTAQRRVGAATDGIYGPLTRAAIQRFQKANGLVQDGVVGPFTWTAMLIDENGWLGLGDRGPEVRVLQHVLGVHVDGIFGPVTDKYTTRMQRWLKVKVDGAVGPQTRGALLAFWR